MRQPNLLVFLPDQQRTHTMACYGGTKVHVPALNKLASESVIFERAYVTHPVCIPSRSSLFTGLWPHTTGCTRNGVVLPRHFPTFTELLQNKDYRCGYMGKWHLDEADHAERGFHDWVSTEDVSDYSHFLIAHGRTPDRPDNSFSRRLISTLPLELSKPTFLEDHACRFIEGNHRDPFILFVAFVEPHTPYNSPFNEEHSLSDVDLDATALTAPGDDIPLRYRLIRERQQAHAILDRTRLPALYYVGITSEEYRDLKRRYFGLMTMVDRSIGAILGQLERFDLMDNTIIVHTSDHGDHMGSHQLFGKETMFEESARVPYLIRMPGQRRSLRVAQAVSHIDFLPTMLDLLGQPKPMQCPGQSRVPLLRGEVMPPQNVFLEWAPNRTKAVKRSSLAGRWRVKRALAESTRAVVTSDGWKLCLRDKDLNELYNLKVDPIEAHNLYYTGKYDKVIARGSDEIHRWQETVEDTLKI
jgi:arylsulfatase